MTQTTEKEAGAWWIEIEKESDKAYACFDTTDGRTLAVNITDASFGGEIEVQDETGKA